MISLAGPSTGSGSRIVRASGRASVSTLLLVLFLPAALAAPDEIDPSPGRPSESGAEQVAAEAMAPPAVASSRPLGEVRVLSGPTPCAGQECYELVVRCPQLAEAEKAELKIGSPKAGRKVAGTILFSIGLGGRGLWEEFGPSAASALRKLRSSGYRTVQLSWERGWIYSGEGHREGQAELACKPATVARWLLDRYASDGPGAAFCATGNSAGSSQIAYMMSDYGLADRIDAAVMGGGPVFSRIDWGCGTGGPDKKEFVWTPQRRRTIDGGFGFARTEEGPCQREDHGFDREWLEASHLGPGRALKFPETSVWMLVGDQDDIGAAPQARIYFEALRAAGSPDVHFETVKRTPHSVPSTSRGAKRVRKILQKECKPH